MKDIDGEYDVIVVGASIAGCSSAMLYGRAGLRVALVERNRSPDSYKAMCGHFILGGAHATLQRLGIWDHMLERGAEAARTTVWTRAGWVRAADTGEVPPVISLRRKKLDPLLRELAIATPGVDLFMGHSVTGLVELDGRITGVRAATEGGERELTGRLVVAADGHRSPVARLAGVPENVAPNQRFLWWAYYCDVDDRPVGIARVWVSEPDVAVVVPAGDGLTLVGAFPSKARLAEFATDRASAIERIVMALPDAPDLKRAVRVSKVIGTNDYAFVRRDPTPRPGLALIGDAAMTSDPVPAVGCSWAFRTAEWLADATAPALVSGTDLRTAMRAYRRRRRVAERYDRLARQDARALPPNPVQRAIFDAAPHDAEIGRRFALFGNRAAPASVLINPRTAARALRVARAHRTSRLPNAGGTVERTPAQ